MAISDYDTTAGNNTSIAGIDIGENCSPANVNNAIRQLMADLATALAGGEFNAGASYQPLNAKLTALVNLVWAANKLIYATGTNTLATTDITSVGRSLLAQTTKAGMIDYLGISSGVTLSGSASSGYITIPLTSGSSFKIQWKDFTASANGATTVTYPTSFSSWSRAFNNGGRQATNAQDNDPTVVSSGTASCSVYNASDSALSCTVIAVGV